MMKSGFLLSLFVFGAMGCAHQSRTPAPLPANTVKAVAITAPANNVDSPAIWIAPKTSDSLVLLTEKKGGRLLVYRPDHTAALVTAVGGMKRPNGVAILSGSPFPVASDIAFVTDRDGNRIHAFSIPQFQNIGEFAQDVSQPMGISIHKSGNAIYVYVVSKNAEANEKVLRYRIQEQNERITGTRDLAFGKELSVGQETVMVDSGKERVLVADEKGRDIKVYGLDGQLQTSFGDGVFQADVEGIGIVECNGAAGYIVVSDQNPITEFEFFDRDSFRHIGTVRGTASRTDGIAITTQPLAEFPSGMLAAQTDPEDSGGRNMEMYRLDQLMDSVGLTCR